MKERIATAIDYEAGIITIAGATYDCSQIKADTVRKAALQRFREMLRQSETPASTLDDLIAGNIPMPKTKAPTLDPWREAGAIVQAEIWAKAQNIKPLPGKRLHDHPEFQALLPAARDVTRAWDRKAMFTAQRTKRIVEVWDDLTKPDTSGIFAAPVVAEQKEAA